MENTQEKYYYILEGTEVVSCFDTYIRDKKLRLLKPNQVEFYLTNKDKKLTYHEIIHVKLNEIIESSIEELKNNLINLISNHSKDVLNTKVEPYQLSNIIAGSYRNSDKLIEVLNTINITLYKEFMLIKQDINKATTKEELAIISNSALERYKKSIEDFEIKGEW